MQFEQKSAFEVSGAAIWSKISQNTTTRRGVRLLPDVSEMFLDELYNTPLFFI